jgi:hypothetical protein
VNETEAVRYDGPAMTPWSVAYLWATVLTNLRDWVPGDGSFGDYQGEDSADRALLARAISITAREQGLLAGDAVPGPGVLSPLSLPRIAMEHLDPPSTPILEFRQHQLGHQPTAGEPGHQAYTDVYERLVADGVTPEEVLADDRLRADLERVSRQLLADAEAAFTAVLNAINATAPTLTDDAVLGQLSGYLNEHLAAVALPDQDTEFRLLLAHQVGWPDGNPPRGLVTSTSQWYKIGWAPGAGNDRARAWCRWVVERGWAVPDVPGDPAAGAWMAVPEPWATPLREAGYDLDCSVSAMMPWRSWLKGNGLDRPDDAFLHAHYGRPAE